jgi:hypothetical protein
MIRRIKPEPVPAISWNWQEGRYWDLWMIVHTLTGTICACIAAVLGFRPMYAYPLALLGLTAWEIGEMAFGINEELENWILDIVFGMFGFWFVYAKVLPGDTLIDVIGVGMFLLLFNGLFAFLGWKSYRKRSR